MSTATLTRKPVRKSHAPAEPVPEIDWAALLEIALTAPGDVGNTYNRFYSYSFTNQMLLLMQGVNEPVATFKRWQSMGRQVQKGSRAKWIVRPVVITKRDEDGAPILDDKGNPQAYRRFKGVRCLFTVSETEGDELPPPVELPEWSTETMRETLSITRVAFENLDGNIQGYSSERQYAINPAANSATSTEFHEIAHIVLGHTSHPEDYRLHRGVWEFQAEATAYLTMHALGISDEAVATKQRGYIQHWIDKQQLEERDIRPVFAAVQTILAAGRPQASMDEES